MEIQENMQEKNNYTIYFTPIVLDEPKRYQCPECKIITGTYAALYPKDLKYFTHTHSCINKNKIPKELIA